MRRTVPHAVMAILFLVLLACAQASAAPAVLFVLDGSGSMWGRAGDQVKITAAKAVLAELLAGLPRGIEAGLMAYGHRRKGDCSDIEVLERPGAPLDRLQQAVQRIRPKGKTPIADTLVRAGKLLRGREDRTTVVLVSDGLETCGGDPCAVARALHEQGHELVIHVVGFGVSDRRAEPLRCIARAGGGRYFPAADAAALRAALTTVRDAVVEHKAIEPDPVVASVPEATVPTKRIRSVRSSRGKVEVAPAAWVRFPPYFWSLVEVESGQWVGKTRNRSQRAKAGEYQIAWRSREYGAGTVLLPDVVSVEGGQTVRVPVDTGLQLFFPEEIDRLQWWWLQAPEDRKPIDHPGRDARRGAYGGKRDFVGRPQVVAPGDHHLWVWQQEHASFAVDLGPIHVEPGTITKMPVDFGFVVQFAEWLEPTHPYWKGSDRGRWPKAFYQLTLVPEGDAERRLVWKGRKGPWLAPPGRYTAYLRLTEHGHSAVRWGTLTVPEHGVAALRIDSGVRLVPEAPGGKPPYRVILVNLDSGEEIEQSHHWTPLPAPPGRYRLDWQETEYGAPRETLVDELVIEPGTLVEVEL